MTASPTISTGLAGVLQLQARITHHVVKLELDGITHAESIVRPTSGGNCLNWVVGHLLTVEGLMLSLLGQPPVTPAGILARYERGAPRIDAGFAAIAAERFTALSWHQAFHAGQAAILRRLAGKPGAIP